DFVMGTMVVRDEGGANLAPVAQVMRQVPDGGFELATADVGLTCEQQQYLQLLDVSGDGRPELICPDGTNYPDGVYDTLPLPWNDRTAQFPVNAPEGSDAVLADF